ncbi:MAG: AMP-binding protein, partial [Candidatus Aminicenantes bacterium]
KSFCGVQGRFFQKKPLVAEGKSRAYIYRTGDLARWLTDGNIEFLGRIDHQVKIRGFRIESEEIENCLLTHENIEEALVVAKNDENGDQYLCAYVTVKNTNDNDTNDPELREYLSSYLPYYMIPSYFVKMEKIPLNTSGKPDRKTLPEPGLKTGGENYEPPRNNVEKKLVDTWSKVLFGRNPSHQAVGINDNFFEIGGDSIKAIQVSAKLKTYGLNLKINHLFLYPTIKELTRHITKTQQAIKQEIGEGEVDLTPIQRWFFQSDLKDKHHFNQAVLLYCEQGFDEEILKKVLTKLVEHHDALRMVYDFNQQIHEKAIVVQGNRGINGKLLDFEIMDIKDRDDIEKPIEKEANRIQQSIDLKTGPLVKTGLFKTREGDHLLIVIHHLVVDGISWRILLEDLASGYIQAHQGKEIKFPGKTDSFKHWASQLKEYAAAKENKQAKGILNQLEYWQAVDAHQPEPLPVDHEIGMRLKKKKYCKTISITLDQQITELLLRNVNQTYNTEINHILLAALGMTIKQWAGLEKITINLEGHGREPIIPDIDISRTVGWFTTQYPVTLDMAGTGNLAGVLKSVKKTLRRIPDKGIGYGILRYLTPLQKKEGHLFNLQPEISFNFLGELTKSFCGGSRPLGEGSLKWQSALPHTLCAMRHAQCSR